MKVSAGKKSRVNGEAAIGRAVAKASSNTAKPGLGVSRDTGSSLGIQQPQSRTVALTGVQEPPQLPLSAHLTAWDSAGPWVGSGSEGGSLGKSSGRGNGSRIHVRERLKRILVWLQPPASAAAHYSS